MSERVSNRFCNYVYILYLARVVQTFDSAILRIKLINHYLGNKYSGNQLHYPLSTFSTTGAWVSAEITCISSSTVSLILTQRSSIVLLSSLHFRNPLVLCLRANESNFWPCCPTYSNRLMPLIRGATDRHFISIRIDFA